MKLIQKIIPPDKWKIPVAILLGAFVGLFFYLFKVSNASSYLSDSPETCINCHVMDVQYASWFHSSHRETANCNDCHVPHESMFKKYLFKAKDGLRHATVFTLRNEPQVIRIKEEGAEVVQANCKRCHENVNEHVSTMKVTVENKKHGEGKLCWDCHQEVPHGKVSSLSSVSSRIITQEREPLPDWLQVLTTNKNKE